MNAITQLTETSLEDTLSRYDIGQLVRYWPAANGIENTNYFIEAETQEPAAGAEKPRMQQHGYVLTIMEQAANAGDAYIPMMDALYAAGLPVAPPLRNMANFSIEEVDGKPAMLQTRLRGQHVFNPTTKQVCALARFVARMHLTMANTEIVLPDYPRDDLWLAERLQLCQGYVPYSDSTLLADSVSRTRSLLARKDVRELPKGMVHGDLFRDNVLFNEHGLNGVLDFHHAATGYWVYDLAVIANDWCNDSSGYLDLERTSAMLRAYHQIRPLNDAELWFFSGFALYAALNFWLSRLAVALDARNASLVRFKNPDEFKRIVAHHLEKMFYLDPRTMEL